MLRKSFNVFENINKYEPKLDEKFKFYLIIDTLIILIYSELEINLVYIYIVISKIL